MASGCQLVRKSLWTAKEPALVELKIPLIINVVILFRCWLGIDWPGNDPMAILAASLNL